MEGSEGKDSQGEWFRLDGPASFLCGAWLTLASELDAPEAPDSAPAGNIRLGSTVEVRSAFTAKAMDKARVEEHPNFSNKEWRFELAKETPTFESRA
jgi:hypothetical protein